MTDPEKHNNFDRYIEENLHIVIGVLIFLIALPDSWIKFAVFFSPIIILGIWYFRLDSKEITEKNESVVKASFTSFLKKSRVAFITLLAALTPIDDINIVEFKDSERKRYLAAHSLERFEDIWEFKTDWFEAPNERRGGWSGVNRIVLSMPASESDECKVFLKRQQNHVRKTIFHPFQGVSTFVREFKMLEYLQAHNVNAPKPVFFSNKRFSNYQRAILITEELSGYSSLEDYTNALFAHSVPSNQTQLGLIASVADAVRKLHKAKVQHRSLYPKHIFVKQGMAKNSFDVAFIDLEKSRVTFLDLHRTYRDLAMLNRHAGDMWTKTKRLRFFLDYMQLPSLTPQAKALYGQIYRRSMRNRIS